MENRYKYELLDLCERLHEECTGTGSGNLDSNRVVEYYEFLMERLKNWQNYDLPRTRENVDLSIHRLVVDILVESFDLYTQCRDTIQEIGDQEE